jgi:hypothetical protein
MVNELVKSMVQAALTTRPLDFRKDFETELGSRVVDAVDNMKADLSARMYDFSAPGDESQEINSQETPADPNDEAPADGENS